MTPTRILRWVIPLVLVAGAGAAPHAQAQGLSFYYVASATGTGSDVPDMLPVIQRTHPLGWFTFASPGRSFTLTLDDAGTLTSATIPVWVHLHRNSYAACVPARTPTRLPGGTRGAEVHVLIDTAWDAELRCSGSGTSGTAYVTR